MSANLMPEKQQNFRKKYKDNISRWYNGWGHLISIFGPGLAVIFYCAIQLENVRGIEIILLIPIFIGYNFCEWWLHKNAMHKPIKGFRDILLPVFHRHVHQHHQYFSAQHMSYDTNREWRIVLFPPYALLIFMALTLPGAVAVGSLWSSNMGYLLMMLTPIYYLNYEVFHLCCHVENNWFVRYCPLVNTIRRHHAAHHSIPIMMERNMNLTYPIADYLMGTSDLNRGLLGHLFNGYNTRYVRKEYVDDQGSDLTKTAGAT